MASERGRLYITNEEGHSYALALGTEYKLEGENEIGETVMATPATQALVRDRG